jgi:hypothetical protein
MAAFFVLAFTGSVGLSLVPWRAQATAVSPCPPPAPMSSGGVLWLLTATNRNPGGGSADYICASVTGAGGTLNSAVLVADPCTSANHGTPKAGGDLVAVDWGTVGCVPPGGTVRVQFRCPLTDCTTSTGLSLSQVLWHISNGTSPGIWDGTSDASLVRGVPLGGTVMPVEKFSLLAPFIALGSIILVVTFAAIYVKRARRGKNRAPVSNF